MLCRVSTKTEKTRVNGFTIIGKGAKVRESKIPFVSSDKIESLQVMHMTDEIKGKPYDGAIISEEDGCLYCPKCKQRIAIKHHSQGSVGMAVECRIAVRGKCKCRGPISEDWSFTYILKDLDQVPWT